jgi:dolichol kinase
VAGVCGEEAVSAFFAGLVAQFISYTNLVINIRSIAHENYLWAIVTDGLASLIGYFIVKRVAENKSKWMPVGMCLGGMLASVVGIWLTRHWG